MFYQNHLSENVPSLMFLKWFGIPQGTTVLEKGKMSTTKTDIAWYSWIAKTYFFKNGQYFRQMIRPRGFLWRIHSASVRSMPLAWKKSPEVQNMIISSPSQKINILKKNKNKSKIFLPSNICNKHSEEKSERQVRSSCSSWFDWNSSEDLMTIKPVTLMTFYDLMRKFSYFLQQI